MKLIVGLGNPGKKYEKTRHNCGFRAIDFYAKKNNLEFKSKFDGLYAEQIINKEKIMLLKPQLFMNLSGEVVIKYVNYFNINIEDIIIIYDDVDFSVGTFKIKRGGSSAGHNGIKNIIELLKTENISRIRIGTSKNDIPLIDYVLGKFSDKDFNLIEDILPTISNIITDYSKMNVDELMQKYNREN